MAEENMRGRLWRGGLFAKTGPLHLYAPASVLTPSSNSKFNITFAVRILFSIFVAKDLFMEEKKLFLLDAYALIYRAYYALVRSPRVTSAGFNTSAIFGFCNTLDEVLRKENPGYIAVCFDPKGGHTFRHEDYPEYKAGRDKQPEDITLALPYIRRILDAYRIPAIEVERYEADDIIGTLSVMAAREGFTTYMMTPDKDYGQLVTDHTLMYRPALRGQGFEIRGPKEVCERYGISSPAQVIDLLALEGDASDNVPGCPGVGEKTAAKLIAEFGSVENLLASTDRLKGKLKQNIEEHADQIRHSKELVTICTNVPLPEGVSPEACVRREPDIEALRGIFNELEFKTMAARLGAPAREAAPVATAEPKGDGMGSLFDFSEVSGNDGIAVTTMETPAEAVILTRADELAQYLSAAISAGHVGIAVYARGANAMEAEPEGIALAYMDGDVARPVYMRADFPGLATLLEPLLAHQDVTLVGEDIKRYMLLLRRMGAPMQGAGYFDTSVAHYVLSPEMKHDLPTLAQALLNYQTLDYGQSATERKKDLPLSTPEAAALYGEKAVVALRLAPVLEEEIRRREQYDLLTDIEFPLIPVLATMEWNGVRVDPSVLARMSVDMTRRLSELEQEAYALAGHPFNVSSPMQVGQVLFEELQIDPKARKTKRGAWSTTEEILEKYSRTHPLVQLILDIRGLRKLLATYIDALPQLIGPDGRIHTTLNQTVTATGRISSTNPNLQNIPIRTPEGREIRRAFVASPGNVILSADYSQIELRLMAHLSADPAMVEAFRSGQDIHRATAAKIYGVPLDQVTDDQRRHAKTANFGIIYGISAFGLSERLGIPRADAKALITGYMNTYPDVAAYMQRAIEGARQTGAVTTVMNRKRFLPDINSRNAVVRGYAERNAVNAPIQGSAADIIKRAMIDVHAAMQEAGLKSMMILQIHDELLFDVVPDELPALQAMVTEKMSAALPGITVPLEVSSGVADNWLDAH